MAFALQQACVSPSLYGIDTVSDRPILVHAPSVSLQAPGGGEVQLEQTSCQLQALGLSIRGFDPWLDRIAEARLLHLFGMSREGLALAQFANSVNVPVVLSPICWIDPRAMLVDQSGRFRPYWTWAKWQVQPYLARWTWRQQLLDCASAILPNSLEESVQLRRIFSLDSKKLQVIPNGVDPRIAEGDAELFIQEFGIDQFVLFVGRIEPRKNLLNLIRAMSALDPPLVVIGSSRPGDRAYEQQCRLEADRLGLSIYWIGSLAANDPMLASAYAAAQVLVLPSWFETPGLVALEAAVARTGLAVTDRGSAQSYLGDEASYLQPSSIRSIRRAIVNAWVRGPSETLRQKILDHYTWSAVAVATREVYDRVAS